MDATIESDTSQNTNSLISTYFIENYSKDDSDKENNSTNSINAILESSEDKVTQRTNSLRSWRYHRGRHKFAYFVGKNNSFAI